MSKKIFLICPVRNADETQKENLRLYVERLENEGCTVYYPARDTNQVDDTGYRICSDNRQAIINSDEVHIFYDSTSRGSLFDLGMVFALNKKLVIANEIQRTPKKSFANMVFEWSSRTVNKNVLGGKK